MPQSLLIAVRFHQGRYHGENDRFDGASGWPPSPARLFQALVAAAADGARISVENRHALEWLEALYPPRVVAPVVRRGRSVKLFVPNNDLDSVGGDPARVSKIRVEKRWRPCFFDVSEPVLYAWDFNSGLEEAEGICNIAARLYQLGRGIDMAWATGKVLKQREAEVVLGSHSGMVRRPNGPGKTETPRPGTLYSLIERHRRKRMRLITVRENGKLRQVFTQPPKALFRGTGYDILPRYLHFEIRDSDGRFAPHPLRNSTPLITGLRDSATARLQKSLPDKIQLFERLIVGRGAGPSDLAQRIRIIPIPSIGMVHTDPSIRRIMVEIPPNCPIRADDLRWAFSGVKPHDPRTGELWSGCLVPTTSSQMADRFQGPAQTYQSVTPVVFSKMTRRYFGSTDRHNVDERCEQESRAVGATIQALRHSGVRSRPADVRVRREPFGIRGERAELFAVGTRFAKQRLWHVSVTFDEPVEGPLVLGDGRFLGLGLMAPYESMSGVIEFIITGGLDDGAVPHFVTSAARRAMMARVQSEIPRKQKIPSYVSGHFVNDDSDRDGTHHHVAVVADLPRRRILYIAPYRLRRSKRPLRREERHQRLLERALQGMDVLRAGATGLLTLVPGSLDTRTDPIFASALSWMSVTNYHVTRHRRRLSDEEALRADVLAELRRIGFPLPKAVEILSIQRTPRDSLIGRLRITFAVAQKGPIVIGRTAHKGGGLFSNLKS